MQTASKIIDDLIRREGNEYSDRPADRGGPTKYGITLATLQAYWPGMPSVDDLKAMTEAQARTLLEHRYIYAPQFNRIENEVLRELMVDTGVQHGQVTAIRMLQTCMALTVDGILGPISIDVVNKHPVHTFFGVLAARNTFYGELIAHDNVLRRLRSKQYGKAIDDELDKLQALNAFGWARRVSEFIVMGAWFAPPSK